jgi:hypothetical protein
MCAGLGGPARKSGGRATGMSVEAFGFFPQWRLPVGTTRSGRLDFFDGPPLRCGALRFVFVRFLWIKQVLVYSFFHMARPPGYVCL